MSIANTRMQLPGRLVPVLLLVPALAWAQGGLTQPKQGQGGSVVQGAAGTSGSTGDKGLEHCDQPMGAMAVVEPQSAVLASLTRFQLSSPVGLMTTCGTVSTQLELWTKRMCRSPPVSAALSR